MRRWLTVLALFSVLAASIAGWWLENELTTPYFAGSEERFITISPGTTTRDIARTLKSSGVLKVELPFILYLRWTGEGRRLQAGEYRFSDPATPLQIVQKLVRGDIYYISVTVPEGLTARETVSLIARDGLGDIGELEAGLGRIDWIADLDPEAGTLEGYLFPDTYRFPRRAGSEEILKAMIEGFRSRFSELARTSPVPAGWNVRRVVTLASLIEKETGRAEERPMVASVLINRLRKKIPLACDPTVIYALKLSGRFDGNIRKADLAIDSPYNTYLRAGLPPGPIACPGADSIRAALQPADTEYLYFVSRNDGTHQFSKSFAAHTEAVNRYQKKRR